MITGKQMVSQIVAMGMEKVNQKPISEVDSPWKSALLKLKRSIQLQMELHHPLTAQINVIVGLTMEWIIGVEIIINHACYIPVSTQVAL